MSGFVFDPKNTQIFYTQLDDDGSALYNDPKTGELFYDGPGEGAGFFDFEYKVQPSDDSWWAITYSPYLNRYSSVATSKAMYSDDGDTWSLADSVPSGGWQDIIWVDEWKAFFAVKSPSTTTSIMKSDDAKTWVSQTHPQANVFRIAYSVDLGRASTICTEGNIVYTDDGINWLSGGGAIVNMWEGLTWASSLGIFLAVASNTGGPVARSSDGITYTGENNVLGKSGAEGVAWDDDVGLFVCVFNDGTIRTSPDSNTWTNRTSGVSDLEGVTADNGRYVAVGEDVAITSTDGINWEQMNAKDGSWRGGVTIARNIGQVASVTDTGDNRIMVSEGIGIVKFDSDETSPIIYEWQSKLIVTPRLLVFTAAQVHALEYPVTFDLYADDELKTSVSVTSSRPFRLPSGYRAYKWKVGIRGTETVNAVYMAESIRELMKA